MSDLRPVLAGPVQLAAPRVLGCVLALGDLRARIVETEAYDGPNDPGAHSYRGMTPRNASMFGPPGHAYVYFTYGNHWMLNVGCGPVGYGAAVLIRAAQPLSGLEAMRTRRPKALRDEDLLSGPGKLAQAFGIDRRFDGLDLLDPEGALRLLPGEPVTHVLVGPRIGLAPGKGDTFPWRFVDADALRWVSRRGGLAP